MVKLAFVCVGNAGRSQMATAYAEAERSRRGLDAEIDIVTGGTQPKEHVHEEVIEAFDEEDIDISDRTPRAITSRDVADADWIVTMGCDASGFTPREWDGELEQWQLTDPEGHGIAAVRTQRDDIKRRVQDLFDRLET